MKYSDLKGKTVVVTGCNRGIGEAILKEFLGQECRVIGIHRGEKPKLVAYSGHLEYVQGDVNSPLSIHRWLANFEADRGTVDILVNNAGILKSRRLIDVSSEDWDETMNTNLKSLFFLSQTFAQHMMKQKQGVIINASSFASKMPSVNSGVYAASKAAVSMLTRSMAAEWAPYGIRVNAYSPGVVETRMTQPAINKSRATMISQISQNRFGTVEEVANAVMFLASQQSSYLTGVDLEINGGKFVVQNPKTAWDYR